MAADTDTRVLTVRILAALQVVLEAAQGTRKVIWLQEDGREVFGHARSIGTTSGGFIRRDEDVRDAHLRITTRTGMEIFVPVARLVDDVHAGRFAIYDWH